MRTHILIATAILLATSSAIAAPRSLSGSQTNPIEEPTLSQKIQVLEAPKPVLPPEPAAPVPAAPRAPEAAPAQTAPVVQPAEAKPAELKPVETVVQTAPAEATPVRPVKSKHVQRRNKQQTAEQRAHREFRNIERQIGMSLIGAAGTAAALAVASSYCCYW